MSIALMPHHHFHNLCLCAHHSLSLLQAENKRVKEQMEKSTDQSAPKFSMADEQQAATTTTDGGGGGGGGSLEQENASYIVRVCQRIQEEDNTTGINCCWALMDFEIDNPDSPDPPKRYQKWKRFDSEAELYDTIRRDTGEPLVVPPYSMSPAQSLAVEKEANQKVSTVTEEFRRFRVRSEVNRKQTDAHVRDLQNNNVQTAKRRIEGEDLVSYSLFLFVFMGEREIVLSIRVLTIFSII